MSRLFDRGGTASRPAVSSQQAWEATRVQTQVAPRVAGAAGDETAEERDIGRAVGGGVRELFVACEPADALIQQFDFLQPEFVAVQDLGGSAARKLLAGIAAATQRTVQQLVVRRNGAGTVLATIEFIDCPASNGRSVRLYSTEVDADTVTRQAMARALLGRSRLGLVMAAELPSHALVTALAPWKEAALNPSWQCRRLLFMPLGPGAALAPEVARWRGSTGVDATTTATVTRPADVWNELCAAWNALQRKALPAGESDKALALLGSGQSIPSTSKPAPVAATPMPMPVIGAPAPSPSSAPMERYLHDVGHLAGVVSVGAFDIATGRPLGHAGARPGPDDLARHGQTIVSTVMSASRAMGLGAAVPELTVTLGQHHLLIKPMPGHAGVALHLVLDKPHATLALVLAQLRKLDDALSAARART